MSVLTAQPPEGRFILHRFNGDEVYRLKSAVMYAYKTPTRPGFFARALSAVMCACKINSGVVTLWFEAIADPENAQRCEDSGRSPEAHIGINLPSLNANEMVGREFDIPGAKTEDEDASMSRLYYYEHEVLNDNRITIVSRSGNRFWLRWTGITQDVCFYDGSKPPTRVEIEGEFLFKDIDEWI